MIVSFYSYKGGVGRTQLCANIAAYLNFYKGKRILLWDWDFEAPGIHFYFDKVNEDINKDGTIELLENYTRQMRSKSGITKDDLKFVSQENFIRLSETEFTNDETDETVTTYIDLFSAANLTSNFSSRVNDFNWFEFYELLDGINYIELLKEKIKELPYDYVFIDSRTGVSDYSGICNIQLPQMNVFVMAPNRQNFNGCKRISNQIINSEYVKKGYREATLMPILSRLDKSHPKYNDWVKNFVEEFSFTMPLLDADLDEAFHKQVFEDVYLENTLLEYLNRISAGENLFFTEQRERISKVSFEQRYINIAAFIEKINTTGMIKIDELIDKDTWLDYAQKAIKTNRNKAAIAYEKAGETEKANDIGGTSTTWLLKGNDYYLKGDKDKAIECYQKAIEIKPDKHEALYNMGLAYSNKGDKDKAIECYQKAIEIKSDKHDAFFNMGNTYDDRGDKDKAIECYQKAIEIKPDKHEAFFNMGNVYYDKGEKDKAIECYQKTIEIKPDFHEAFNNMGNTYDDKGDKDKAIECYQKAIGIKPDKHRAFMSIGFIHIKLGNLELAEEYLTKSVKLGSTNFGNMNLGHVYLAKQKEELALQTYIASIKNFENKEKFFGGFDDDFQFLVQYGITEQQYNEMKEKIKKLC